MNPLRYLCAMIALAATMAAMADEVRVGYLTYATDTEAFTCRLTKVDEVLKNPEFSFDIVIPDVIESENVKYAVTAIGTEAFLGCAGIKSILIGQNVTNIESFAFRGCSQLTELTIPRNVTAIGGGAFKDCGFTDLYFNATDCEECGTQYYYAFPKSVINVYLAEDVNILPHNFVRGCKLIETLTLPERLTKIGPSAFRACSALEEIELPASIEIIDDHAFEETALDTITIPANVKLIGDLAFGDIPTLKTVFFNAVECSFCGTSDYPSFPGHVADFQFGPNIVTIPVAALCKNIAITKIELPQTVTRIGNHAFYACKNLVEVSLSPVLEDLGIATFDECTSLRSISIPEGITTIHNMDFYGCKALEDVALPNSLVEIEDYAFKNCNSLKTITLPYQLKKVGHQALYCTNLESICSYAPVAPQVDNYEDPFLEATYSKAQLFIPEKSLWSYKASKIWRKFLTIKDTLGVDDVSIDSPVEVARYSIDGRVARPGQPGIHIIRYSDGSTVKIAQ